jgi:hypothetical protein
MEVGKTLVSVFTWGWTVFAMTYWFMVADGHVGSGEGFSILITIIGIVCIIYCLFRTVLFITDCWE